MRRSDCADAQAGLRLCCSHTPEDRFSGDKAHPICYHNGNLHRNDFILSKHFNFERLMIEQSPFSRRPVSDQLPTIRLLVADSCRYL